MLSSNNARDIQLIDPKIIVTLRSVALDALKRIQWHELNLKQAVGKIMDWDGRLLVLIYHPSPQVLASHRREFEQIERLRSSGRSCKAS